MPNVQRTIDKYSLNLEFNLSAGVCIMSGYYVVSCEILENKCINDKNNQNRLLVILPNVAWYNMI